MIGFLSRSWYGKDRLVKAGNIGQHRCGLHQIMGGVGIGQIGIGGYDDAVVRDDLKSFSDTADGVCEGGADAGGVQ